VRAPGENSRCLHINLCIGVIITALFEAISAISSPSLIFAGKVRSLHLVSVLLGSDKHSSLSQYRTICECKKALLCRPLEKTAEACHINLCTGGN